MLSGYDVFNMVGEFTMFLAEQAVLTTIGGPLPHELPRPHRGRASSFREELIFRPHQS
jgi:hypothetical protein